MTPAAFLLAVLGLLTLFGCVAFLLPDRPAAPHRYVTDPWDLAEGGHVGRHRDPIEPPDGPGWLDGPGSTTRKLDDYLRWPGDVRDAGN